MKKFKFINCVATIIIIASGCSPKLITQKSLSSGQRQQFSMELANKPVRELTYNDQYSYFYFVYGDINKNYPAMNTDSVTLDYINKNYKIEPVPFYALDFNALKTAEPNAYSEKLIINDTIHTAYITTKGTKDLGVVYAKKIGNVWHASKKEPNYSLNPNNGSTQDYSPNIRLIRDAQKISNNVFMITTTPPNSTFPNHVIGYTSQGHIYVVTIYYGQLKKYDSVNNWLMNDEIVQNEIAKYKKQ